MAQTTNLGLPLIGGETSANKVVTLSEALTAIDKALGGVSSIAVSGNVTLTAAQAAAPVLVFSGTPSAALTVTLPAQRLRRYVVKNSTSVSITIKLLGASSGYVLAAGAIIGLAAIDSTTLAAESAAAPTFDPTLTVSTVSGTSYSLSASDNGKLLRTTNSSTVVLTLPSGLATGWNCAIVQAGAGRVSIATASGVTLFNRQSHNKTAGQYSVISLIVQDPNVAVLAGDTGL